MADGGTFRSMVKKRTAHGKAAIARNRPGLDRAEATVNRVWSEWLAGRPTECKEVLDSALAEWMALSR